MFLNFFTRRQNYLILIFTLVYMTAFTAYALWNANNEFLYYTIMIVLMIYLVLTVDKRLRLAPFIILNLSLLGFFHLLGGNYYVGNTRLYDYWIVPNHFRYDNFVHTYGSFIATLTLYSMIANFVDEKLKKNHVVFSLILILMAAGIGTFVELFELSAVVFLGAGDQVGGYFNNAFDLFFNLIGAILASIVIYFYRERVKFLNKIDEKIKKNS